MFGVIFGVALSGGLCVRLLVVGLCGLWWLACGWWVCLSGLLVIVFDAAAGVLIVLFYSHLFDFVFVFILFVIAEVGGAADFLCCLLAQFAFGFTYRCLWFLFRCFVWLV